MQNNVRKFDIGRPRPNSSETKQIRKVHTRKVPYKVGYSWNKGGRLKELRIRHLARKFLKIWMHNTFGRALPQKANSHFDSVVLRRAFEGWRDEWWTSRREWSLTMRAECHYRYYLYNVTFQSWRMFMSLLREKQRKLQIAQSHADRQRMRLVWERWEVFTEMRRMKKRMLESAFEHNRLTTLHSTWRLWHTRLQQQQDLYTLEDQALNQEALALQKRTWLQWRERYTAACCQRENESKALLHFILKLKRKMLHQWMNHVSCCQTERKSQAVVQHACHLHLVKVCWGIWRNALHHRWSEEHRLQAAGQLATQSIQRRALEQWKAYVRLCRDQAKIYQMASQNYQHHLLRAGLQGLSLNTTQNKTQRMNNNVALQHYHQTMTKKFWKLWQHRLEEAEDKSFQSLTDMAQTNYSTSLLSSCFHHWKERFAEQRHMQELEHRADVWFSERMLPQCFSLWVEFTLQRRLQSQRRHKAEVYNQQRQYSWVFYTWWGRSEKHKEQMLSERMAILHEERCLTQRFWAYWRQRTEHQISEEEKQKASDRLYLHQLLHRTMTQWKDNSTEIRDRRNREQQACKQGDLLCMKWALERWKKFVQNQKVRKSNLEEMQRYHDTKLLKHTFVAWKTHHLQMSQIYSHTEELYRQRTQHFLRTALSVWRENAVLQAEVQLMEQQAQNHFDHSLQFKVFLAWKEAATRAVSKRRQQEEAFSRVQRSINQVNQLQAFRLWRKHTRDARRERICMEKARQHHNTKLLSKALKIWNKHHYQYRKHKVMKRQSILLLRLKMYQTYFELWKIKLQCRRREVEQSERALWHWSLTLQAKVLCGWRLWVTEQRRKQEEAASVAQVYRDKLLREGVTCILTYAAHMNDLTVSLTQHRQEQRSFHIQRVVRRCARRWKQQTFCKPRRDQAVKGKPPKKIVTFSLSSPGLENVSPSDSAEQDTEDGALSKLLPTRMPRRKPRSCGELFESQMTVSYKSTQYQSGITGMEQKPHPAVLSHLPVTSTHQIISSPPPEPQLSVVDSPQEAQDQDLLLPPSAFMTTGAQNMLGKFSSPGSGHVPLPHQFVAPRFPERLLRATREETGAKAEDSLTDPVSTLTRELLSIQLDMKSYQEDRKQLRAWQKLKGVLQNWLHTSGEGEQMEKDSVCQELTELEECIHRLSTDLSRRKPVMLLHAERIQHLQTVLNTSLPQKTQDMETDCSVFTT